MSLVVLDDHLLRAVLGGEHVGQLGRLVESNDLATTNLYYVRLCKSVVGARGGALTGSWSRERRRALGRRLLELPDSILIPPMRLTGYRLAELAEGGRISTLGAEALAVAEHFDASLCVWEGDDGHRHPECGTSRTGQLSDDPAVDVREPIDRNQRLIQGPQTSPMVLPSA